MFAVTIEFLTNLVTQVGVPSAICLFLIWQSAKREERTTQRVADLEKFNRVQLVDLVKQTTTEQASQRSTIDELIATCNGLLEEMRRKPCLYEQRVQ